ncbi:hypothetical protein AB4K20DRAFT_1981953 [Rhizopus microsporus]|uniref:Uncharacterized protein n=1 Tax=Rhizopus microsporus TaxID=58291 RepID=A0A1X0S3H0_RHIZD|nr:hypothetical protein BCV71DRAFT_255247 [Rhizopus microsporus]
MYESYRIFIRYISLMHFPSVINLIDLFMALSFKNSVRLREMTTLLNKRLVATECHIEQTRRHRYVRTQSYTGTLFLLIRLNNLLFEAFLSTIDEGIKGGMGWPTFLVQDVDTLSGKRLVHAPKHIRNPHQRAQVFKETKPNNSSRE